ncbi:hypothetical protein D3C71_24050 [compost metagenome]
MGRRTQHVADGFTQPGVVTPARTLRRATLLVLAALSLFGSARADPVNPYAMDAPAQTRYVVQVRSCKLPLGATSCRWEQRQRVTTTRGEAAKVVQQRQVPYRGVTAESARAALAEGPEKAEGLAPGEHQVQEGFELMLRPIYGTGEALKVMYELNADVLDAWQVLRIPSGSQRVRVPETTNTKCAGTTSLKVGRPVELHRGGYAFELTLMAIKLPRAPDGI